MLYLRLLKESLIFAINALRNNKLRTLLSLLGVTVGIFSIIAVLAAVDSMDQNIRKELSNFDNNMLNICKYSFAPTDVPRWRIESFPNVTYDEFENLKRNIPSVDLISFNYFMGRETFRHEHKSVKDIQVNPCGFQYESMDAVKVNKGRFFSEAEDMAGSPVIVIGSTIAENLFGDTNAIGQNIRGFGKRLTVIGVIEKQGSSSFGQSKDLQCYLPANFIRQVYGENSSYLTPTISIKPKKNTDNVEFKDQVTQKLRIQRGLKPSDPDTFFLNEFAGLTKFIDQIIGNLNLVGWIISGFSLLVGGFGIANIMFVSVKERTNIIGIQKSLGAKNHFILFQFLFEAIILSLIGGILGILMVWLIAVIVSAVADFSFVLSFTNILIGVSLAGFIGLLSGLLPAISASRLDPVEAIRTGI